MLCPFCNFENPQGAKFCAECGASFESRCRRCGFENPPRSRFCAQCGASLSAPDAAAAPQERVSSVPTQAVWPIPDWLRRQFPLSAVIAIALLIPLTANLVYL